MNFSGRKVLLVLETALDGGSICIFENHRQIDCAVGTGKLSKSEDILLLSEDLLQRNGIKRREIKLIVVSDGPGSLTGIRIGLSIAKGLADALSAEVLKISALEALAYQGINAGRLVAALYTEKTGVFFREFFLRENHRAEFLGGTGNVSLGDFKEKINCLREECISFVFTKKLVTALGSFYNELTCLGGIKFFVVEESLANVVGLAGEKMARLIMVELKSGEVCDQKSSDS